MEPRPEGTPHRGPIERAIVSEDIRALGLGPAITVPADTSLYDAVQTLQREHIGCVLVTGAGGKLVGIFTERDLLAKVALRTLDWKAERVADYMTADPESLHPEDRIAWALNLMHIGGDRHAPPTPGAGPPGGGGSLKDNLAFIFGPFPPPGP